MVDTKDKSWKLMEKQEGGGGGVEAVYWSEKVKENHTILLNQNVLISRVDSQKRVIQCSTSLHENSGECKHACHCEYTEELVSQS